MTEAREPMKNIAAARRRGPIQVAIHGIKPHATSVPAFSRSPLTEAVRCATAIGVPEAVSLVMISVGAQKVQDHRPKMMQAIIPAAAHVVRAWGPRNIGPTPAGVAAFQHLRLRHVAPQPHHQQRRQHAQQEHAAPADDGHQE